MRGKFVTAAALAGLVCVATWSVASAASPVGSTGSSAETAKQQAATPTQTKTKGKTKRSKIERPHTNWLNPQPEPPRPDTTKKMH